MKRIAVFVYGVISYAIFFATFLYAIGFVGNVLVPKSMDSAAEGPFGIALAVNVALLGVFAIQHSVMARPGFKRWLTSFIPEPAERSTYCLLSSAALILLFWQWRPMGGIVWDVQNVAGQYALLGLFAAGWLMILVSTFMINHFDLFGLRQVWLYLRGKEYTHVPFTVPGFYKHIRHPLYVGWFTAFWATPTMTVAHLLFAIGTTAYMLIAIQLEERDLKDALGAKYIDYRNRVPMFVPKLGGKYKVSAKTAEQQA